MQPLVSIITPARMCGPFLEHMIQSIRAQTYANWELLISAAGSADPTYTEATRIAHGDERIYVRRETAPGFAVNWNAAYNMSMGDVVARQEADDWSDPRRLELGVAALVAGADVVSCGMVRIMADGVMQAMPGTGAMRAAAWAVPGGPPGPGSDGIMAWRRVYSQVGLYDPVYDASADTDWTFRALVVEPVLRWFHIDHPLYFYRDHPEQMTKRIGREGVAVHLERQAHYAPRIRALYGGTP